MTETEPLGCFGGREVFLWKFYRKSRETIADLTHYYRGGVFDSHMTGRVTAFTILPIRQPVQ